MQHKNNEPSPAIEELGPIRSLLKKHIVLATGIFAIFMAYLEECLGLFLPGTSIKIACAFFPFYIALEIIKKINGKKWKN